MSQPKLFNVTSPKDFLDSIVRTRRKYESKKTKYIEDVLFMFLGLNHLREWIAPGYDHKSPKTTRAHQFYHDIFNNLAEFKIIKSICNHSKHRSTLNYEITTIYSDIISDWDDLASVKTLSEGVPISHFVDGKNIIQIIDPVIDFYKSEWFDDISN